MEYGIFARTFLFPSGEGIRATVRAPVCVGSGVMCRVKRGSLRSSVLRDIGLTMLRVETIRTITHRCITDSHILLVRFL